MDHSLISLPSHPFSFSLCFPPHPSLAPSHLLFLPPPPPHFPGDELENIIGGLRNEVKSAGMQDTRENCWSFFIERVRRQLKVKALCVCVCLFVCLPVTNWYVCKSSYTTTYNAQLASLNQVVLCFSPVGSTLRVRARKFPAIVNCTNIDWFHEWPEEALISVSSRFLAEVDLISVSYFTYTTHPILFLTVVIYNIVMHAYSNGHFS